MTNNDSNSDLQPKQLSIEELRALLSRVKNKEDNGKMLREGQSILFDTPGDHIEQADKLIKDGIRKYKSGNVQEAYADFEQSLKICTTADGYYNRGVVALDFENFSRAISDFTAAIIFHPEYANAYNNRAISIMGALLGENNTVHPSEVKDIAKFAKNDFQRAVNLGNYQARSHLNRVKRNFNV